MNRIKEITVNVSHFKKIHLFIVRLMYLWLINHSVLCWLLCAMDYGTIVLFLYIYFNIFMYIDYEVASKWNGTMLLLPTFSRSFDRHFLHLVTCLADVRSDSDSLSAVKATALLQEGIVLSTYSPIISSCFTHVVWIASLRESQMKIDSFSSGRKSSFLLRYSRFSCTRFT